MASLVHCNGPMMSSRIIMEPNVLEPGLFSKKSRHVQGNLILQFTLYPLCGMVCLCLKKLLGKLITESILTSLGWLNWLTDWTKPPCRTLIISSAFSISFSLFSPARNCTVNIQLDIKVILCWVQFQISVSEELWFHWLKIIVIYSLDANTFYQLEK